jgi:ankyrin repeat protein
MSLKDNTYCDGMYKLILNKASQETMVATFGDMNNSILHTAVLDCNACVVKAILEKARSLTNHPYRVADFLINYSNEYGEPPLFLACFCNKLDIVRLLLDYDAPVEFLVSIRHPNIPYEHLLHNMVFKKHYEIAALLLSRMDGSFKNYFPSDTQQTALHLSIVAGDRRMTELLIKYDCKVHPAQWDTVVLQARENGHNELLDWLNDEHNEYYQLFHAIQQDGTKHVNSRKTHPLLLEIVEKRSRFI